MFIVQQRTDVDFNFLEVWAQERNYKDDSSLGSKKELKWLLKILYLKAKLDSYDIYFVYYNGRKICTNDIQQILMESKQVSGVLRK